MPRVINENGVSSGAAGLYYVIKDHARGKNWPECWPGIELLADELGRSARTVQRHLSELVRAGELEIVRRPGTSNLFRVVGGIMQKPTVGKLMSPPTPMSPPGVTPMSPPLDLHHNREATNTASSASTEVLAAAAGEISSEEAMTSLRKSVFEKLVKLGMPATDEMAAKVSLNQDLASDALRHCQRRFAPGRKRVPNRGGYIVALLRDPAKFGFVQREGVWIDPEAPSGLTDDEYLQQEAARKAKSQEDRARRQADDEKHYADMRDSWERLPEKAKQEIRGVVLKDSPLFHGSGADAAEFELQCMREAFTLGRHAWRKKHLAQAQQKAAG